MQQVRSLYFSHVASAVSRSIVEPRACGLWARPSLSLVRVLHRSTVVGLAQPNPKGPTRTVQISCSKCQCLLYKYRKGGKGSLVKCYLERIVDDYTGGKHVCPECGSEFGREAMIHGKPAIKIAGGKTIMKK